MPYSLVLNLTPRSPIYPNFLTGRLLSDTCSAFASVCNGINENVNPRLINRNSIQAVCYQDVKNRFGLTANHVVRACGQMAANRLTAKLPGEVERLIQ